MKLTINVDDQLFKEVMEMTGLEMRTNSSKSRASVLTKDQDFFRIPRLNAISTLR